jgi:hypothetical protein
MSDSDGPPCNLLLNNEQHCHDCPEHYRSERRITVFGDSIKVLNDFLTAAFVAPMTLVDEPLCR